MIFVDIRPCLAGRNLKSETASVRRGLPPGDSRAELVDAYLTIDRAPPGRPSTYLVLDDFGKRRPVVSVGGRQLKSMTRNGAQQK